MALSRAAIAKQNKEVASNLLALLNQAGHTEVIKRGDKTFLTAAQVDAALQTMQLSELVEIMDILRRISTLKPLDHLPPSRQPNAMRQALEAIKLRLQLCIGTPQAKGQVAHHHTHEVRIVRGPEASYPTDASSSIPEADDPTSTPKGKILRKNEDGVYE